MAEQAGEPSLSIRETLLEAIERLAASMPPRTRIELGVGLDVGVQASAADLFEILLGVLQHAVDLAIEGEEGCDVRITGRALNRWTSVLIRINCAALSSIKQSFDLSASAQCPHGSRQGLSKACRLALVNGGAVEISACSILGAIIEIVLPH